MLFKELRDTRTKEQVMTKPHTKNNPGPHAILGKVEDDEPIFVIRAKDKYAASLVWLWTTMRELDQEDSEVIADAQQIFMAMLQWAKDNDVKVAGLGTAGLAAMCELIRVANFRVEKAPNEMTTVEQMRLFMSYTAFENPDAENIDPVTPLKDDGTGDHVEP